MPIPAYVVRPTVRIAISVPSADERRTIPACTTCFNANSDGGLDMPSNTIPSQVWDTRS